MDYTPPPPPFPPPFTPPQEVRLHSLNLAVKVFEFHFTKDSITADTILDAAKKFENYIKGENDESN